MSSYSTDTAEYKEDNRILSRIMVTGTGTLLIIPVDTNKSSVK